MKNRSKTFDAYLQLLKTVPTFDDYGRPNHTIVSKTVLCKELSVGSNEVYQARQQDIFLEKKFVIHSFEYEGQTLVEFEGKRFKVVRVYGTDLEETELTVTELRNG